MLLVGRDESGASNNTRFTGSLFYHFWSSVSFLPAFLPSRSLSSANNAGVLFLFEEAAWAPIGHEGGGEEMEAVTVRDGDIGPGRAY